MLKTIRIYLYGNTMGQIPKTGGGRPPKFREPRHPVTMTLPERILDQLAEIDPDRTCAVVKVTEAVMGTGQGKLNRWNLSKMAPGKSLIVVGPSKTLRKISWVKLIEITRARYLLSIPSGTPIETLEVALRDLSHHPELLKIELENNILRDLLNLIGLPSAFPSPVQGGDSCYRYRIMSHHFPGFPLKAIVRHWSWSDFIRVHHFGLNFVIKANQFHFDRFKTITSSDPSLDRAGQVFSEAGFRLLSKSQFHRLWPSLYVDPSKAISIPILLGMGWGQRRQAKKSNLWDISPRVGRYFKKVKLR